MSGLCRWPLVTRLREGRTDGSHLTWHVTSIHEEAADRIVALEAQVERLLADARMNFTGEHYCDLRNFIQAARAEWEPHLGEDYMDDLDERVRQALIAHRATLEAENG